MKIIRIIICALCLSLTGIANSYQRQHVTGTLEILVADYFDTHETTTEYYLEVTQPDFTIQSIPLNFPNDSKPDSGGKIDLTGFYQKDGAFSVEDWKLTEPKKKYPVTPISRKVLYVSLNLANAQVAETPAQLIPVITASSTWLQEATFNNVAIPPDSNGDGQVDLVSVTISNTTTPACDVVNWGNAAVTKLQSMGIDTTAYQHLFFMLPPSNQTQCTWAGLAYVGCGDRCKAWSQNNLWQLVHVHELGHNLGFAHAGLDFNDDEVVEDPYGDGTCPMGNTISSGYYNAPHQRQLNWLSEATGDIAQITENGSYSLMPMSTLPLGGTRVFITDRDASSDYYISYRPKTSFDIPNSNFGVSIYSMAKTLKGYTYLIKNLLPGEKWSGNSLSVKVGNVGANGNIQLDVQTSCFQDPVMAMTPVYANAYPRHPETYTLTITNPQAATCPSMNITLGSVVPSNLKVKIPTTKFVLSPGQSQTEQVSVVASANTNTWSSFTINASATNGTAVYAGHASILRRIFMGKTLPAMVNGLNMSHYVGSWTTLPDLSDLTPDKIVTSPQVRMTNYTGQINYALNFEGFIQIKTVGDHYFYLTSDDGASLTINGNKIINSEFFQGGLEQSAMLNLQPGLYPIVVEYFQSFGGANLILSHMEPNSTVKLEVPTTDLFSYAYAASESKKQGLQSK